MPIEENEQTKAIEMKEKKVKQGIRLAYFLAVINAIVIGVSFLVAKKSLDYANPFDTLMFRFSAAFLIILIPVSLRLVKVNYRGKPIYKLLLLASMYPIAFFMFQTTGLEHATSGEGGIINAITPVITMLFAAVFLKEATTLIQKCFTLVSVAGVAFIFLMKGSSFDVSELTGVVLLLASSMVFAGYSVMVRSISKQFSTSEISFFMVGAGFVITLLISIVTHAAVGTLNSLAEPLTNLSFVILMISLGVIQLCTALMGNYVLSRIESSKAVVFINLSTVVSIVGGTFVLGEDLHGYHIVGSLLIIAGVIGANVLGRRRFSQKKDAYNHAEAL
ncbi:DMT family transporter [Paenibacillus sinopodophylli]|uniref:DMT family transporter n=1 Tax=Paenibacillus sinopodophylli TaxID=1837342 RepID=UPI001FED1C15|nr:DMT family transporter [Paenibacillus sinopodophylli]